MERKFKADRTNQIFEMAASDVVEFQSSKDLRGAEYSRQLEAPIQPFVIHS